MDTATTRQKLQEELQHMPDDLLEELHGYMQYLQYKIQQKDSALETAYASEAVLEKDWNTPEEDQAWQNL